MIPEDIAKKLAEHILLSHVEDVEWLSITEMTSDYFEYDEGKSLRDVYQLDEQAAWHQVDAWLKRANVEITFDED